MSAMDCQAEFSTVDEFLSMVDYNITDLIFFLTVGELKMGNHMSFMQHFEKKLHYKFGFCYSLNTTNEPKSQVLLTSMNMVQNSAILIFKVIELHSGRKC